MPDMIKVKPGVDPTTGELYQWWHPTQFRKFVSAEGTLVPHDLDTMRALNDGSVVRFEEAPAAAPAETPRARSKSASE